ncbi:hypothetical protein KI387_029139, partial [Taxus chinensis]
NVTYEIQDPDDEVEAEEMEESKEDSEVIQAEEDESQIKFLTNKGVDYNNDDYDE